jgi:tetratricopeptide (TPR) repeat protein
MKKVFLSLFLFILFSFSLTAIAADWKMLSDHAVSMSADGICSLENTKHKTSSDIYQLAIIYVRQFDYNKNKKLLREVENLMPDTAILKWLQALVFMQEHRLQESSENLLRLIKTDPEFYPAAITLAHVYYLKKDFTRSYSLARQLMERKKDLSRYHYVVSLLIAGAAKGIITKKTLERLLPSYFEVHSYFKEAEKMQPQAPEVLFGLGSYYLLIPAIVGGNNNKAIKLLEKARELTPLNVHIYVRLAQANKAKGNLVAYHHNISKAREIDSQDELLVDFTSGKKDFLDVP